MLMNSNPKISIVTTCYNAEKFIHRLHDSLCRQEYKNFERILVDDCSSDNTVEVLKNLPSPGNGGIAVYKLPQNSGGGVALGFGVEKCQCKICIIIDHDDELIDSALSIVADEWESVAERPEIAGLFYRRLNPMTGEVIGEELCPGTEFSMSWQANIKPSISDGFSAVKTEIAKHYFNSRSLELICLAGVPATLMTKKYKMIAGQSRPLLLYHRDNIVSQTNSIKISRKTVYTYAKYIDAYDAYYFRRPLRWIRHIIALIKFSTAVHGYPTFHHKFIKSKFICGLSYILIPLGVLSFLYSKRKRDIVIIDFSDFPLDDLNCLVNIHP
jgi:glycosyltransferase involved in cell wall biosynthesis